MLSLTSKFRDLLICIRMTKKLKKRHIIIELDVKTFDIVFWALNYLADNICNHAIVDSNRLLVDKKDAEDIIRMLKAANDSGEDLTTINMNTHDWYSYINMITYSSNVLGLPYDFSDEEEDFLETYSSYISEQEEQPNFYEETILKKITFCS